MSSPDPPSSPATPSSPDPPWFRTVPRAALSERTATRVVRNGRALCLALADGDPVAVEDVCAHRQTALSAGLVRDGILTCPGHFWRFDLRTGRCLNRDEEVPAFACRTVEGWVEVQVPDRAPPRSVREMLLAAARRRTSDR